MFYEDTTPDPIDVELVWEQGFPRELPFLRALYHPMFDSVLGEAVPHAQRRALYFRALEPPLGASVLQFSSVRDRKPVFRSLSSFVTLDTTMASFYGNVRPALSELERLGLYASATTMWLDAFQQRSPVNRVATVAQMLVWGAGFLLGERSDAIGVPSRFALERRITPVRPVTLRAFSSAILFSTQASLGARPTERIEFESSASIVARPTDPVTLSSSATLTASGILS